jgi:serine O-acetyltransferase
MDMPADQFPEYLYNINKSYCEEVPAALETRQFVDNMVNFLFPIRVTRELEKDEIVRQMKDLIKILEKLLKPLKKRLKDTPEKICRRFLEKLPGIYRMLLNDAEGFARFDPASDSVEEVILCYPGFFSIAVYRLAHELYLMEVPVLPRIMAEYAHSITGVDIHPGARIGSPFFIDHGTGTVIGETTMIGNNVKIYQGVTLGALFVEKKLAHKKRHPTIEDNVIIYARSTILGGNTVIGHDTIVGGNVWLTESVPPYSVVYQTHQTNVKDNKELKDQINWII